MDRKEAFKLRFGNLDALSTDSSSAVIDSMLTRYTDRSFTSEPIQPGVLELCLSAAQCSPSSGWLETRSILKITSIADKEKIVKSAENTIFKNDHHNGIAIKTAPVTLLWLADLSRLETIIEKYQVDRNIDSQIKGELETAEYHLKAIIDTTIAAQTFAICAESLGLGVMYCGALRQLPYSFWQEEFNLPKHVLPIFGMVVGNPTTNKNDTISRVRIKPRLGTTITVHENRYMPINKDVIEEYNSFHREFRSKKRYAAESEAAGTGDYINTITERIKPAPSKECVSDNLKQAGFTFK